MLGKPRAIWKDVKYFREYYNLSKSHAYDLIKMPDFPCMYVGEKCIRVDMSRTDKWFEDYFRR